MGLCKQVANVKPKQSVSTGDGYADCTSILRNLPIPEMYVKSTQEKIKQITDIN